MDLSYYWELLASPEPHKGPGAMLSLATSSGRGRPAKLSERGHARGQSACMELELRVGLVKPKTKPKLVSAVYLEPWSFAAQYGCH